MEVPPNSNDFFRSAAEYDKFMGRYSIPLAKEFVKTIPIEQGNSVLEIGCGPGALTGELVSLVGEESISVIDPSPPFLAHCANMFPGITADVAAAERIPFPDSSFNAVVSQLVIHFIKDLPQAGREIMRVIQPSGWVAVCTWNVERMQKINLLPRAAKAAGVDVPPMPVQEFTAEDSIARYLESIGLKDVERSVIVVSSTYASFHELWEAYLLSVGPMGPWTLARPDEEKAAIKGSLFHILGEPIGEITLTGEARVAWGQAPA